MGDTEKIVKHLHSLKDKNVLYLQQGNTLLTI